MKTLIWPSEQSAFRGSDCFTPNCALGVAQRCCLATALSEGTIAQAGRITDGLWCRLLTSRSPSSRASLVRSLRTCVVDTGAAYSETRFVLVTYGYRKHYSAWRQRLTPRERAFAASFLQAIEPTLFRFCDTEVLYADFISDGQPWRAWTSGVPRRRGLRPV
jgi:hypothetical protein